MIKRLTVPRRAKRRGAMPQAVLFDLDGTLVDNSEIMYECQLAVFGHYGVRPPSFVEFWTTIAPPFEPWYREWGIRAPQSEIDVLFEAAYRARMHRAVLMPGALELIRALQQLNLPMGIVSGNSEDNIRIKLERFRLHETFTHVHGGTLQKTPNIALIVAELGVQPSQTLFVGDRPTDIVDAIAAGVVPIGFTGGHPTERFLRTRGHPNARIISSLLDLLHVRL